jgi:Rod binding domain-containing protein
MNNKVEFLPMHHDAPAIDKKIAAARDVAGKFEGVFVRTMVQSLRQSSQMGGEGGGLFGDGPGADTYADWFDDNIATQVSKGGRVGIADHLMRDLERWQQIPKQPAPAPVPQHGLKMAPAAQPPLRKGGSIDVAA